MTAIATITYKNQLTLPSRLVNELGFAKTRKVLLLSHREGLLVKPLASSVDSLAGSLARANKARNVNRKLERQSAQKLIAQRAASEGM